jgi:hypothetical protein
MPIIPQITIEENSVDTLQTTDHPVERNATITDHSFMRPKEVTIRCAWSNSPSAPGGIVGAAVGLVSALGGAGVNAAISAASAVSAIGSQLSGNAVGQVKSIYAQLLALQASCVPFTIYTGKRVYTNMLFTSITVPTDIKSENSLVVTLQCKEIIIVTTQVITVPINPSAQANPKSTTPSQNLGPQSAQTTNAFVPDATSLTGACTALNTNMSSVQSLFSTLPGGIAGASGTISGALGQLPGLLSSSQGTLTSVMAELPFPVEIPTIPSPQSFTIPLDSSLNSTLSSSLNALPASLGSLQQGIGAALQQLPNVLPSLPASFSGLGATLTSMQSQITNVLGLNTEVISRATVPTSGSVTNMSLNWNNTSQAWMASLADASGNPMVNNVPLVTGANLLEQFGHLGFPGQFIAQTDNAPTTPPGFSNLGTTGHLFFVGP